MLKQLDVFLFLKKFSFLERATEFLLLQKDVSGKEFYSPENIRVLKKRRRKYKNLKREEEDS